MKQILNKIREETNTTIIIVTHRLSSVYDADKIIVLSDGKVEVTGNHSELIKGQNWYSRVWKMQNEDNDIKKNS